METSAYAVSDETGAFIQLTLTDAVLYPGEDTDRYVHMAVSLIAVIVPRCDQQTKKSLFTGIFY